MRDPGRAVWPDKAECQSQKTGKRKEGQEITLEIPT